MMVLTDFQRKVVKWVGYPLVAVVVFVFALQYTFSYSRVGDAASAWLGKYYNVKNIETSAGILPGNFSIHDIELETRPESETEKPIKFTIDEISVKLGILAAIGKKAKVDVEVLADGGRFYAAVEAKKTLKLEVESESFPLDPTVAFVRKFAGDAPIRGKLDVKGNLDVPDGKWSVANAKFDLACANCTFGEKGSQLKPMNAKQRRGLSGGLTLPRALKLGNATGKFTIKKGKGKFQFDAKSTHGEVHLTVEIDFRDPVNLSEIKGYMKFKMSDELLKQDTKLESMQFSMAAAKLDDGLYGARIFGTPSNLKVKLSKRNPLEDNTPKKPRPSAKRPTPRPNNRPQARPKPTPPPTRPSPQPATPPPAATPPPKPVPPTRTGGGIPRPEPGRRFGEQEGLRGNDVVRGNDFDERNDRDDNERRGRDDDYDDQNRRDDVDDRDEPDDRDRDDVEDDGQDDEFR